MFRFGFSSHCITFTDHQLPRPCTMAIICLCPVLITCWIMNWPSRQFWMNCPCWKNTLLTVENLRVQIFATLFQV